MAEPGAQRSPSKASPHQHLSLKRLSINELPCHPELSASQTGPGVTVVDFIATILTEIAQLDLDAGFSSCGKWHPHSASIDMPVLESQESMGALLGDAKATGNLNQKMRPVHVSVDQKVKKEGKSIWCGRTSYHLERDVTYSELDNLLSRDHSLNEARYTPSVYDANELLVWNKTDLDNAVVTLGSKHRLEDVELSIFEMFHKMPAIGGLKLLEDRVFHVLVITVHSTYHTEHNSDEPLLLDIPQSFTAQIPVDFDSLSQAPTIQKKSHMQRKGNSQRYQFPSDGLTGAALSTPLQSESNGNKLTEGVYVSLERLRKAPKLGSLDEKDAANVQSTESLYHHRWDMMTLSDAGGITRIAPPRQKQKEILDAIAADVEYVIKHIAVQRQSARSDTQDQR